MQKLAIEAASDQQLREFAENVLQLDNVPAKRAGIISALVEAGHTVDHIFVAGDEAPPASTASEAPAPVQAQHAVGGEVPAEMPSTGFHFWTAQAKGKPPCPMVTLRILATDRPGGDEPAHPIINNSPALKIQRNKLVRIPYDFYEVLKQAGGTAVRPGARVEDAPVEIPYIEYPMTDVILPPASEIAAWREWAGQQELGHAKAAA